MSQTPHDMSSTLTRSSSATAQPQRTAGLFDQLNARELRVVRAAVKTCRHPSVLSANIVINSLGNGWLYLPVAVLIPLFKGRAAWRFILAASLATGITHLIYPWLKSWLARKRPCDFDQTLGSQIKALDKYSCPSGHCMTASAVGIPIILAFPGLVIAVIIVWLLIGLSRLSLGHHYPSDLVFGWLVGAVVALPIAELLH